MIRLYKQQAEQLLVMLTALKKGKPDLELDDFVEDSKDLALDEVTTESRDRLISLKKFNSTINELIEILKGQITKDQSHEKDLIDVVTSMLNIPYLSNGFSLSTLRRLRDAVLRPDELENLKADLRKGAYHCSSCQRSLHATEPIVIQFPNDVPTLMCIQCKPPQVYTCVSCKTLVASSTTSSAKLWTALTCPDCNAKKTRKQKNNFLDEGIGPDRYETR